MKNEHPKHGDFTVFLDRTHGKALGTLLRRVGFKVRSIYEVYPRRKHESTSDPEWIAKCGKEGWLAISGDKRLETNITNKKAVIDAKAKVFILTDTNSLGEEWAASVIVGRDRFYNTARKNEGPFFVNIGKQANSHVANLRFPKMAPQPEPERTEMANPAVSETSV